MFHVNLQNKATCNKCGYVIPIKLLHIYTRTSQKGSAFHYPAEYFLNRVIIARTPTLHSKNKFKMVPSFLCRFY